MSNLASIESAPISPRMLSDGRISKLEDLYEAAAQLNFYPRMGSPREADSVGGASARVCPSTLDVPRSQGGPRCGWPADRRLARGAPQSGYA